VDGLGDNGPRVASLAAMRRSSRTPLAGRYLLIDQIGVGGMGSVWRARDQRSGRFVAAKVLGQHDAAMLLRFVREQSVRIDHPHVVAPSGWAAEDDLVALTMDLVRGGSVQTLLDEHGPLPESYVAVVLDQTLQALEAIHAAGVVHRDIKPANLLLEPTGTGRPVVRVADFGVAALVDDVRLTRVPGAIGTHGYMAPELGRGATPEPRQDLYAAGVVAVQLLTGLGPPHPAAPPPGRLQPLLAALTSPDPDRRPPTAPDALARLRRLGVPPGAPWQDDPEPPRVRDRIGEPGPRSGPRAAGATATGVAIACFVLALLLTGGAAALLVVG
jgi:serine/threonine protein kinase